MTRREHRGGSAQLQGRTCCETSAEPASWANYGTGHPGTTGIPITEIEEEVVALFDQALRLPNSLLLA